MFCCPPQLLQIFSFLLPERAGLGDSPLYEQYRYVPPQRVWFLRLFRLKAGIDIAHFDLARKSGMIFQGTTGACERMNKKESRNMRIQKGLKGFVYRLSAGLH